MHKVDCYDGRDYIGIGLQYLLERSEFSDREEFFKLINSKISSEFVEQMMSLATRLKEEGRLEGRAEGLVKGRKEGRLEGEREIASKNAQRGL